MGLFQATQLLQKITRRRYTYCMEYAYILRSQKDGTFYSGVTENLKQRVKQHNSHKTKSTSKNGPYDLVWYCCFPDKLKALKFEKYLKSSSGFAFRNKHLI